MSFSLKMIDKTRLLRDLRERVASDLDALIRRQRETQQGATHEESRAEHAKDTRATEQSYLARGLAMRVDEMRQIANNLANIECPSFRADDPVALMAIVVLRENRESDTQTWWLVPGAGGIELSLEGKQIHTLTPAAPLGRALIGLHVGDEGSFATPRSVRSFEVLEIA
jgi:transcription elongation GreA/GreB family factor